MSCAFPFLDWVVFTCGALPFKKKTKDKFTFTTKQAENLGVWKVPAEEAAAFPIIEKQNTFVERLEQDTKLVALSVDPRTDEGMKALLSGSLAAEDQHLATTKEAGT